MTKILFDFAKDTHTGKLDGLTGKIRTRATAPRTEITTIVLPAGKDAIIKQGSVIDLPQTVGEWCWSIEFTFPGIAKFTEYVLIPAPQQTTIPYSRLTRVDPETLEPNQNPDSLWWAKLNELIALGGIPGEPGKDGEDGKDGKDGRDGIDGQDGRDGDNGIDGDIGPEGRAATITIGSVSSGAVPNVVNSGTVNAAILDFILQQGLPGSKGEPGLGVNSEYDPTGVTRPYTAAPSTYPLFVTEGMYHRSLGGWPNIDGAVWDNVTTFRHPDYPMGSFQIIRGYQKQIMPLIRFGLAGDVWSTTRTLASSDLATPLVAGLLSAVDKKKLDATPSIVSGRTSLTPTTPYTFGGINGFRDSITVTFPEGTFTKTPTIVATSSTTIPGGFHENAVGNETKDGFTLTVVRQTSSIHSVNWVAIST